MASFGEELRQLRERTGLSQEALADRAGLSRTTVSALERGLTQGVDFTTLAMLATALGVRPGQLVADDFMGESPMHQRYANYNPFVHQYLDGAGWFVLRERYDFDRDALVWDIGREAGVDSRAAQDSPRIERGQLRITRNMLDDTKPAALPASLKSIRVAEQLGPGESVIVKKDERGLPVCVPLKLAA